MSVGASSLGAVLTGFGGSYFITSTSIDPNIIPAAAIALSGMLAIRARAVAAGIILGLACNGSPLALIGLPVAGLLSPRKQEALTTCILAIVIYFLVSLTGGSSFWAGEAPHWKGLMNLPSSLGDFPQNISSTLAGLWDDFRLALALPVAGLFLLYRSNIRAGAAMTIIVVIMGLGLLGTQTSIVAIAYPVLGLLAAVAVAEGSDRLQSTEKRKAPESGPLDHRCGGNCSTYPGRRAYGGEPCIVQAAQYQERRRAP